MRKIFLLKLIFIITIVVSFTNCKTKKVTVTSNKNFVEKSIELNKETEKKPVVLYIVDGKKVTAKEISRISPDDIEIITVIKNDKEILKYTTDKKYEGVILIKMKKK